METVKKRKKYSGELRDKERTKTKLVEAVGEVLKERGYTGLTIANIAKASGLNRRLIPIYFGSVENLIETYIRGKDYWLGSVKSTTEYFGKFPDQGSRGMIEKLLMFQMDEFAQNEEMQKIITWEISESSELMSKIAQEREQLSTLLFAFADNDLKGRDIDLRAAGAILVSSIYYLTLHAKYTKSTFCEIDIASEEGMSRIRNMIKRFVEWTYVK